MTTMMSKVNKTPTFLKSHHALEIGRKVYSHIGLSILLQRLNLNFVTSYTRTFSVYHSPPYAAAFNTPDS